MLADRANTQTQTDRQTDRNTPLAYRGGVKIRSLLLDEVLNYKRTHYTRQYVDLAWSLVLTISLYTKTRITRKCGD